MYLYKQQLQQTGQECLCLIVLKLKKSVLSFVHLFFIKFKRGGVRQSAYLNTQVCFNEQKTRGKETRLLQLNNSWDDNEFAYFILILI